jgi:uncharacterized protein (TIRG00374 family)
LSLNYVTPVKAGVPLRIYLYRQIMQVPFAVGIALAALEILLGMLVPAVLSIVGIVILYPGIGLGAPIAVLGSLAIGTVIVLFAQPSLVTPLLRLMPLQRFTLRLVRFGERVQKGFREVSAWRLAAVALLFLLNFAVAATRLYVVLVVLERPVDWPSLLAVSTISITAGNLSMIPMGLGVRDVTFTLLLTQSGVPGEIAVLAAVIQRLFAPGWPLMLGLISTSVLGISEIVKVTDGGSGSEGSQ